MKKSLTILDAEYLQWVQDIVALYRRSQIKAAIKVNTEQLKFNWLLGRDIVEMKVEERWGEGVIEQLSKDLKKEMPGVEGLSVLIPSLICGVVTLTIYNVKSVR